MTISILFVCLFVFRRSPKPGVQALLPVSCPGVGKSRGLGVCCSPSPPHFHILYQHLHTWVVTTQALPVCAESAIQKACQREGISTQPQKRESPHSLRREKPNDRFGREKRESVGREVSWSASGYLGLSWLDFVPCRVGLCSQAHAPQGLAVGSIPSLSYRGNPDLRHGQIMEKAAVESNQTRS